MTYVSPHKLRERIAAQESAERKAAQEEQERADEQERARKKLQKAFGGRDPKRGYE